jgi:hypothetical protein
MYEYVINCPQDDDHSFSLLKDQLSAVIIEYERKGYLINEASKRITFEPKRPMTYNGIIGEKAFLHMLIDEKQPKTTEEFAQFICPLKFVKGYHLDDTTNYKFAPNERVIDSFTMSSNSKAIVDYLKKDVTVGEYKESKCSALNNIAEFAIVNAAFHRLWTKAVGTSDYNKEEWMKLEKEILDYQVIKRDYVLKMTQDTQMNNMLLVDQCNFCLQKQEYPSSHGMRIEDFRNIEFTINAKTVNEHITLEFLVSNDQKNWVNVTKLYDRKYTLFENFNIRCWDSNAAIIGYEIIGKIRFSDVMSRYMKVAVNKTCNAHQLQNDDSIRIECSMNDFFNAAVKFYDHALTSEEIAEEFKKGQEVWKEQYKYSPLDYPKATIFDLEAKYKEESKVSRYVKGPGMLYSITIPKKSKGRCKVYDGTLLFFDWVDTNGDLTKNDEYIYNLNTEIKENLRIVSDFDIKEDFESYIPKDVLDTRIRGTHKQYLINEHNRFFTHEKLVRDEYVYNSSFLAPDFVNYRWVDAERYSQLIKQDVTQQIGNLLTKTESKSSKFGELIAKEIKERINEGGLPSFVAPENTKIEKIGVTNEQTKEQNKNWRDSWYNRYDKE